MFNLIRICFVTILTTLILSFSSATFAALVNEVEGASVAVCSTTAQMMTANGDCRTTPAKYEVQIFEMGVCTSHP